MICFHKWTEWYSRLGLGYFIRIESQEEIATLGVRMCRKCGKVQWKGDVK